MNSLINGIEQLELYGKKNINTFEEYIIFLIINKTKAPKK